MTNDPKLDLVLERLVEVSPELVWMTSSTKVSRRARRPCR